MYRILLADDEGIVIDSLKFIIERSFPGKCEVESAKTGRAVIELAESFRPDIAIMDIQMPGINGIEAMKEIRRNNPSTVMIVLSAYDKFDYAREAINLGVLEYLNKPFDRAKIVGVLTKAMEIIDAEKQRRRDDLAIKEKLETIVPIIENGFIQNLLFHEHFKEDIDNYKTLLSIEAEYGYMLVVVSGQEQVGNYMKGAVPASIKTQKEYTEIRGLIENYFNGTIGSVMGNKLPVLIPCMQEELTYDSRTEIVDRARGLVKKLTERLGINFRVGIGGVKKLEHMSESYGEALNALVRSTGRVAHADDMLAGCEYDEDYPIKLEKAIFENVKDGNTIAAVEAVNRFFDWMEQREGATITDIQLKVIEFILWAEHLAYENGGYTYHFLSRTDYLPKLMTMQDYGEIRAWFVDKVTNASAMVSSKQDEKSVGAIDQARRYIEENFHKELSLDDVSREVDISPYYFSKLFKNETGEGFVEYLTNLRIEKAKELLTSSSKSVKEICGEVGYSDPNYFSRIFKKSVGCTPTEYKENPGRVG